MEDDLLRRGLLGKRGGGFDKLYEDCMVRIQRVKQKNDVIQKQLGTEIEESIRSEVNNQRVFLEKEITELKNLMQQIETKYRDPESKNRLKQLKADAQKQIERNRIILKDLINKSFAARSIGRAHEEDNSDNYMLGGAVNYNHLDAPAAAPRGEQAARDADHQESILTDGTIDIDYELERKIMLEKNEIINEVEQSTLRINEIMNDMGMMVEEQGEQLDVISEELMKTTKNMVDTNSNLEDASELQRKSRKKYVLLVVILVFIVLVVAGLIFFLVG